MIARITHPGRHSPNWGTHRVARIEFPREELGAVVERLRAAGFEVRISEPEF